MNKMQTRDRIAEMKAILTVKHKHITDPLFRLASEILQGLVDGGYITDADAIDLIVDIVEKNVSEIVASNTEVKYEKNTNKQ